MPESGQSDNRNTQGAGADVPASGRDAASPEISPDLLKDLPDPIRGSLQAFFASSQTVGLPGNPLLDKVESTHIDKVLELHRLQIDHEHQREQAERKYGLIYFSIVTFVVLFVLVVFGVIEKNPALLTGVLGAILGSGGGYGIGYFRGRRSRGDA